MGLFGENNTKPGKKTAVAAKSTTRKKDSQPKEVKASTKDLYAENAASQTTTKTGEVKKVKFDQAYKILVKPLVTEKASMLAAQNKYMFAVSLKANKISVAKAIEAVFGIKPVQINIIKMEGKVVRTGRNKGKRKDWKKAIVTLPAGKTIQVYEGV